MRPTWRVILSIAVILALTSVLAVAQEIAAVEEEEEEEVIEEESSDLTAGGTAAFFSHYMWRGESLSDGAVFEPDGWVSYKGLTVDVWGNYEMENTQWTEIDFTASYAFTAANINWEVGYVYYGVLDVQREPEEPGEPSDEPADEPPEDEEPEEEEDVGALRSHEIFISAGFENILNPTITTYIDVEEGVGAFIEGSVGYDIPLYEEASLTLGGTVGLNIKDGYVGVNDEGEEYTGFHHMEISASASLPVWKLSVEPLIAYTFPLSDNAKQAIKGFSIDGHSSHFWGGVSVSIEF
ncbi:MAG: hypothetical protein AB1714_23550 [Acidobacteriota bacterium]